MGFVTKVKIGKNRFADNREYTIDRKTGIGGSDVDSVFNLAPYGCARKLYYEKTETPADYEDFKDNYHMRRGIMFEDLASEVFCDMTKQKVRKPNRAFRSDAYPYMIAHIDRLIIDRRINPSPPLEIKCPSRPNYAKIKFKTGIPYSWILQGQHYMFVRNSPSMQYFIFSPELAEGMPFSMERDEYLWELLVKTEGDFWDRVQKKQAPDKLDMADTRCAECLWRVTCHGDIGKYLEVERGLEVDNDPKLTDLAKQYLDLKELESEAKSSILLLRDEILKIMDTRPKLQTANAKIYQTVSERKTFDTTKFKSKEPELYQQYIKVVPTLQLRLYALNEVEK